MFAIHLSRQPGHPRDPCDRLYARCTRVFNSTTTTVSCTASACLGRISSLESWRQALQTTKHVSQRPKREARDGYCCDGAMVVFFFFLHVRAQSWIMEIAVRRRRRCARTGNTEVALVDMWTVHGRRTSSTPVRRLTMRRRKETPDSWAARYCTYITYHIAATCASQQQQRPPRTTHHQTNNHNHPQPTATTAATTPMYQEDVCVCIRYPSCIVFYSLT